MIVDLRPLRALFLVLAFTLCAAFGCSSEPEGSGGDEIYAEPFPTTIELSSEDLAGLAPDPGDGTLRFDPAPAALADVQVGRILVAGVSPSSPHGLLRAVLGVERSGSALVLKTGQAPIQLAYRKLHVRFTRSTAAVEPPPIATQVKLGQGSFEATKPFEYVLFDGDGNKQTDNDQLVVDGTLGGGFDYELSIDVDWGIITELPEFVTKCIESFANIFEGKLPDCSIDSLIPEARVAFIVHPKVNTNVNVHGAALIEFEKEVDLASATLTPLALGPLVFVPVVDLTASVSGGASASFRAGVHGSAVFETSVYLSSKNPGQPQLQQPELVSTDFGPNDISVTLRANAKVGAGARLNILLFGVTGPYANAQAYAKVEADLTRNPCFSIHAGVDVDLGIKVTTPALPLLGSITLVDWEALGLNPIDFEVASGSCLAPPDASVLPPGSGPDAQRYANPTFAPWSRTFTAPVDGALVSGPGNSTAFADLERTIDGYLVRAGWGVNTLTKTSERGDLVWARDLLFEGQPLRPLRTRPTTDGAFVVVSTAVTAPIVLTKLAQDGTVLDARAFDVPLTTCNVAPTSMSPDGAGGHWIAGECIGKAQSFLLHAGRNGTTMRLLGSAPATSFDVRLLERIGPDAFLAGHLTDGTDSMFALRLRPDGSLAYAKRYQGCAEAPDAIPSAGVVGKEGDVTIAGSGGAQHNGLVARILPDGNVGFASFPGFGFGAGSVFLLDSIAELPTTGYVAGASSVQFTGEAPSNVPSAGLVGLDASGRIIWARKYTFASAASFDTSAHVGLKLTDDGGIFASAALADAQAPLAGRLWSFKPFAKDGTISFTPGAVVAESLGVADLPCSLVAADRPVQIATENVPVRTVAVTSVPAQLSIARQTAD